MAEIIRRMSVSERLRLGGEIIESGLPWPMLLYPPGNRDLGSDIARGLTSVRGGGAGRNQTPPGAAEHSKVEFSSTNVTSADKCTDELKNDIR